MYTSQCEAERDEAIGQTCEEPNQNPFGNKLVNIQH